MRHAVTTHDVIDTAVEPSAERPCEMKCGASGAPEPGYQIFVCAGCLDRADALRKVGQMESRGRILFVFDFE